MSRLAVQHCIACLNSQAVPPVGANNFYNLLGVGHVHTVAADVEFPSTLPELHLFTRFINGAGVKWFETEVFWLDAPEGTRFLNYFPPSRVTFRANEPFRDHVFRLLNVPLEGVGCHAITLYLSRRRGRRLLSDEYFNVVRLP